MDHPNTRDDDFLLALSLQLTDHILGDDPAPTILKTLKAHTGADLAVFSTHDPDNKTMRVRHIETDGLLLKTILRIAGEKISNMETPLPDTDYHKMLSLRVKRFTSLSEPSYNAISPLKAKAINTATGLRVYYGITHFIGDDLYATTLLGFKDRSTSIDETFLHTFAHLTSLALRNATTERLLQQKEERLRQINDNISDVVWTADLQLNTTYVSPSVTRLTGEDPATHSLRTPPEKFCPDSLTRILAVFTEELENEVNPSVDKTRTRIIEADHLLPDGSTLPVEMHMSFIRDEAGRPQEILGVTRDISERRRAEQALRESEEKYRTLVEEAGEGILIAQDGKFVFVNRALSGMLGHPVESLIGTEFAPHIHPDDRQAILDNYRRRVAGGDVPSG